METHNTNKQSLEDSSINETEKRTTSQKQKNKSKYGIDGHRLCHAGEWSGLNDIGVYMNSKYFNK